MSFESPNFQDQAPQTPEDNIPVLEDFVIDPLTPEQEAEMRDKMIKAVASHEAAKFAQTNEQTRENLAEAAKLMTPLLKATTLMANSFKSEQTA